MFLCGVGLCFGYALLGAGWMVAKTENALQEKVRHLSVNLYISQLLSSCLQSRLSHH